MNDFIFNLIFLALYIMALYLGNPLCRLIFKYTNIKNINESSDTSKKDEIVQAGRVIGILERLIIVIGILLRSWELVAGVIALKSISRYKELDHQITAEYFLIGSMISIL